MPLKHLNSYRCALNICFVTQRSLEILGRVSGFFGTFWKLDGWLWDPCEHWGSLEIRHLNIGHICSRFNFRSNYSKWSRLKKWKVRLWKRSRSRSRRRRRREEWGWGGRALILFYCRGLICLWLALHCAISESLANWETISTLTLPLNILIRQLTERQE